MYFSTKKKIKAKYAPFWVRDVTPGGQSFKVFKKWRAHPKIMTQTYLWTIAFTFQHYMPFYIFSLFLSSKVNRAKRDPLWNSKLGTTSPDPEHVPNFFIILREEEGLVSYRCCIITNLVSQSYKGKEWRINPRNHLLWLLTLNQAFPPSIFCIYTLRILVTMRCLYGPFWL